MASTCISDATSQAALHNDRTFRMSDRKPKVGWWRRNVSLCPTIRRKRRERRRERWKTGVDVSGKEGNHMLLERDVEFLGGLPMKGNTRPLSAPSTEKGVATNVERPMRWATIVGASGRWITPPKVMPQHGEIEACGGGLVGTRHNYVFQAVWCKLCSKLPVSAVSRFMFHIAEIRLAWSVICSETKNEHVIGDLTINNGGFPNP